MDLERFEKLENRIEVKSYTRANSGKATLWYWAGIFFQFLNIGICFLGLYWFLSRIFPDFTGKNIVFGLISVSLLVFWEFLKRSTVLELATNLLKARFKLRSHLLPGILLGLFLVGGSGYMAIRGAKEISDTSHQLATKVDSNLTMVSDSVEAGYNKRIQSLETQSQSYVALAADKGRPMSLREAAQVQEWTRQGQGIRKERDAKILGLQERAKQSLTRDQGQVQTNSLTFLIMTLGIETIILFCIFYGAKFDFTSYYELFGDAFYQRFRAHVALLDIVYQSGKFKEGDDCMAQTRVTELAKLKRGIRITPQDLASFFIVTTALNITKTSGGKRRFLMNYAKAQDTLNESNK